MAAKPKPKELYTELLHRGPHQVLRGDLALIGLPGVVFTPRTGTSLPAVAFGHGWLQPADRYLGLFRHLASWGIVVAAPSTQRGPLASSRLFAADLRTALDVCTGVRLGDGDISVSPEKLGLAGHSTGGGAAVLAAAEQPVKAVATLAASQTKPFATDAAARCAMPSLHLGGGQDLVAPPVGHSRLIAANWGGPAQFRLLPKVDHMGFAEGRHWSGLLIPGASSDHGAARLAKILLTAFFLVHLAGEDRYRPLLDTDVKGAPIEDVTELVA